MRMRIWLGLAMTALTLAAAVAEDWPRWLGPRGDGISRETNLLEAWPEAGPTKLWSVKVGRGYSSVAAVQGRLYVFTQIGDQDILRCLDAETGRETWAQAYQTDWRHDEYFGTRTTPTVEGAFIYTYGGGGQLLCRKLDTGEQVWRTDVLSQTRQRPITWGAASSPLILDDRIFVQGGDGGPMAVAVNKADGAIAWRSEAVGPSGYATVALAEAPDTRDRHLIVFAGTEVVGMAPATGKTLWRVPHQNQFRVNAATPLVREGRVFLSRMGSSGGLMLRLQGQAAHVEWRSNELRSEFPPPILDGEHVLVNDLGTLRCFHWPDGNIVWSCQDKRLDLQKGGSMLRVGEKLLTLSETGLLSWSHATAEGIELISQVKLFEGAQNWATPTLHNGRLYAKGPEELVCLDLRAPALAPD